jgi:hypothetical protein
VWRITSEDLAGGRGLRFTVKVGTRPATFAGVLRGWRDDPELRSLHSDALANAPWSSFRWETPPVTSATADRAFEFVLLDSPGLAPSPDRDAFAEHFKGAADDGIVAFPNLGGDAIMVVPCEIAAPSAYAHLAAFVRGAPAQQRHALWQRVAETMLARLSDQPVWLSTAGAGVSWLHVRLDDRPKYYSFSEYRRFAAPPR